MDLARAGRKVLILALISSMVVYMLLASLIRPTMAYAETDEDSSSGANISDKEIIGNNFLGLTLDSAILIEESTGDVIYEFNADEVLPPASMVKMVTEYLILEAIEQGKFGWDSVVTISERAASVGGSGVPLATGHKYTVTDLFNQLSIYSSNYAAVALAEFTGSSEEAFVDMMNEKAKEFNLSKGAHFSNATGLDNEDYGSPPNTVGINEFSARDATIIARHLIEDHPNILEFTSRPQEYRRAGDTSTELMPNWNLMLESWIPLDNLFSKLYAYEGVDGLKTGHTLDAGWCFTGTAERNGFRLISVVMGTHSEEERFGETRKLFDYGFNNYEKRTVVTAKTEMEQLNVLPVRRGNDTEVPLVTESGLEFVMRKEDGNDRLTYEALSIPEEQLVAPIKQGEVLGTLTVTYDGKQKTVNLIAAQDVEEAGWFKLLFRAIGNFFSDIWNGIMNLF